MLHLFENSDGEVVAADSAEQASQHHDVELGGYELQPDDWTKLPDDRVIGFLDDETNRVNTKTCRELAAECKSPVIVATQYG